jgi:MarR family transcriptional regulator, organic hydroperoxide resistance regulator
VSSIALFRHAILALQRNGSRELSKRLRAIELTPAWAEAIAVIESHGPLSIRELGQLLVCEADHPSKLVARMVKAGLLQRRENSSDGRAWTVDLTEGGEKAARRLARLEQTWDAQIAALASIEEIEAVLPTLLKLLHQTPASAALAERYGEPMNRVLSAQARKRSRA